ncbi:unnamed protein product [Peronospora belbahrii]|uniref:Uncharacterized protein n=1 Tax=Peronospora belbahrii TaxID=622444 RepID=A0AAU9L5F7_9STRA|nr:unnamed protein product [Peronospora belbahrii]
MSWSSFLPLARICNQQCVNRIDAIFREQREALAFQRFLVPQLHHTVSTLGGGAFADSIAPDNLMIVYVDDKYATDASHAANFVTNGISSPDAMHPIAPLVAYIAPNESALPVSPAAVTEFLLLRQGITRFVRDDLQKVVDKQKENADKRGWKDMLTFNEGDKSCYRQVACQTHQ